jgi:hypothetical protein
LNAFKAVGWATTLLRRPTFWPSKARQVLIGPVSDYYGPARLLSGFLLLNGFMLFALAQSHDETLGRPRPGRRLAKWLWRLQIQPRPASPGSLPASMGLGWSVARQSQAAAICKSLPAMEPTSPQPV